MSTFIKFNNGETVLILDVCVGSKTMHKNLTNGVIYERERTAVKRAIIQHRKKIYNSTRKRRKRRRIIHTRRLLAEFNDRMPTITTVLLDGKIRHIVVETGKKFKKLDKALLNALRYVKFRK